MSLSSAGASLVATNRSLVTVEWDGAETARADEVSRVAVDGGDGHTLVVTGAPLDALLERHAKAPGRGCAFPEMLAGVRELAGEAPDVRHELVAARRLLETARALVPTTARANLVAQSSAVDVVSLAAGDEVPRVAHRRTARVTVAMPVERIEGAAEAKGSVCVAGTLDAVEERGLADTVERVAAQADRLEHSTPTPAWEGDVVFSPEAAGVVVHEAIGHLLEADNYTRLVERKGATPEQQLAPPFVNVTESAHERGHWGSVVVDDEGVVTKELHLLAEGRVRELITDSAWAARLRGRSSGRARRAWDPDPVLPRLSRIGLSPGTDDPDEVVARGGDALYVESLSFGGLDARTGIVKLVVREARRIRTGRLHFGGFVEEPAAALLSRITAVGRDVQWHQSLCLKRRQIIPAENGAPTMLLSSLQVRPAQ